MAKPKLPNRMSQLTASRRGRWAIASYAVAIWLALGLWGYSIAMRSFLSTPSWMVSGAKKQFSGRITSLSLHGFWRFTHFRLRVGDSEELAIPPEIAYPLWSQSPKSGELLSDLIQLGQEVSVTTTGGSFPVVLDLFATSPEGKLDKLLDAQDSIPRFVAVRANGETKASVAETLAVLMVPGVFVGRWIRARKKKAGT